MTYTHHHINFSKLMVIFVLFSLVIKKDLVPFSVLLFFLFRERERERETWPQSHRHEKKYIFLFSFSFFFLKVTGMKPVGLTALCDIYSISVYI